MKLGVHTRVGLKSGVRTYQSSDHLEGFYVDMDRVSDFPPEQDVHRVYARNRQ